LLLFGFSHKFLELASLFFLLHFGIVKLTSLLLLGLLNRSFLITQFLHFTFFIAELSLKLFDSLLKVASLLG